MARLANDVVGRIKSDISLLRLVESQGYQPKKQGKDYATQEIAPENRLAQEIRRPD